MERDRKELAEALEIIGGVFDIDGMAELASKVKEGMSGSRVLAIAYKMEALLIKQDARLADQLVAWHMGKKIDQVAELEDPEYGYQLRDAIIADVCGFFGLSPRTDGTK